MTAKRKTMAGMGKGVDAFFAKPEESVKDQDDEDFERATFYIRPEQQTKLEELRIGLRKHKVKTNKSELVRTAIDLLAEQSIEGLAKRMARRTA
jgi:hypothetical protein